MTGAFASPARSRGWWSALLLQRWRCSHCLWNAAPGVLDEGPPQRERRRRGRGREKRRGARGLTFEQCRQEVMTQFSTWAVKHRTKKWKRRDRWRKWVERWCLRPTVALRDKPVKCSSKQNQNKAGQAFLYQMGIVFLYSARLLSSQYSKLSFSHTDRPHSKSNSNCKAQCFFPIFPNVSIYLLKLFTLSFKCSQCWTVSLCHCTKLTTMHRIRN